MASQLDPGYQITYTIRRADGTGGVATTSDSAYAYSLMNNPNFIVQQNEGGNLTTAPSPSSMAAPADTSGGAAPASSSATYGGDAYVNPGGANWYDQQQLALQGGALAVQQQQADTSKYGAETQRMDTMGNQFYAARGPLNAWETSLLMRGRPDMTYPSYVAAVQGLSSGNYLKPLQPTQIMPETYSSTGIHAAGGFSGLVPPGDPANSTAVSGAPDPNSQPAGPTAGAAPSSSAEMAAYQQGFQAGQQAVLAQLPPQEAAQLAGGDSSGPADPNAPIAAASGVTRVVTRPTAFNVNGQRFVTGERGRDELARIQSGPNGLRTVVVDPLQQPAIAVDPQTAAIANALHPQGNYIAHPGIPPGSGPLAARVLAALQAHAAVRRAHHLASGGSVPTYGQPPQGTPPAVIAPTTSVGDAFGGINGGQNPTMLHDGTIAPGGVNRVQPGGHTFSDGSMISSSGQVYAPSTTAGQYVMTPVAEATPWRDPTTWRPGAVSNLSPYEQQMLSELGGVKGYLGDPFWAFNQSMPKQTVPNTSGYANF